MRTLFTRPVQALLLAAVVTVGVAGCQEKGPAEKTGEKIDKTAKDAKDALDPRGPAEKAGAKVDKATGN